MGWMARRTVSDPVAFFTMWMAVFTFFLVISTFFLWRATRRSARIAENALTKLERPRILSQTPQFGLKDGRLGVQFGLINFGREPGRIKEIWIKFVVGELPSKPDLSDITPERPNIWILPINAQEDTYRLIYSTKEAPSFFVAKIVYEWEFGTHVHAFARTIDHFTTPPGGLGFKSQAAGGAAYNYDT